MSSPLAAVGRGQLRNLPAQIKRRRAINTPTANSRLPSNGYSRMGFRIHLSPPHLGDAERELLLDALDSNWIAPLGPHVDAFEREVATHVGVPHAVALSSGTAALHLALLTAGVGPGDTVLCPTLTFVATANAIVYCGAEPVFVDADADTWQMDPQLVERALADASRRGQLPAAIVTVDLYGQCADHDAIMRMAAQFGIPVIEDAAEALGATYDGRPAGGFGLAGVFSFNGNKIITTSGGGMLVTGEADVAARVRHLATQAREPAAHYEHREVGFNYRLSNLLAAIGRGQLGQLDARVKRRREINQAYREQLGDLPGVAFMPDAPYGEPTNWLTCATVDPPVAPSPDAIRAALADQGIEARPVWKPMHLQPVFASHRAVGGEVAADIFSRGICLPSGSALTADQQNEIIAIVRKTWRR